MQRALNDLHKLKWFELSCTCFPPIAPALLCPSARNLHKRGHLFQRQGNYSSIPLEFLRVSKTAETHCFLLLLSERQADAGSRGTHYLLERNSKRGMAMLAVAEICVNLTIRTGKALMIISGISTLQIDNATTHWLAQRKISPCSRQ